MKSISPELQSAWNNLFALSDQKKTYKDLTGAFDQLENCALKILETSVKEKSLREAFGSLELAQQIRLSCIAEEKDPKLQEIKDFKNVLEKMSQNYSAKDWEKSVEVIEQLSSEALQGEELKLSETWLKFYSINRDDGVRCAQVIKSNKKKELKEKQETLFTRAKQDKTLQLKDGNKIDALIQSFPEYLQEDVLREIVRGINDNKDFSESNLNAVYKKFVKERSDAYSTQQEGMALALINDNINETLKKYKGKEITVGSDGNCFYRSIVALMGKEKIEEQSKKLRASVVKRMRSLPQYRSEKGKSFVKKCEKFDRVHRDAWGDDDTARIVAEMHQKPVLTVCYNTHTKQMRYELALAKKNKGKKIMELDLKNIRVILHRGSHYNCWNLPLEELKKLLMDNKVKITTIDDIVHL